MSQSLQGANGATDPAAVAAAAGALDGAGDDRAQLEARARATGWRPREEFRGPPAQFVEADEYLRRAENDLPLLRQRVRSLTAHVEKLTRDNSQAVDLLNDMGERVRRLDQTAYARAKADLERQREEAVQSGDVNAFRDVDRRLRETEQNAPKPAPTPPAAPPPAAPPPEVVAWAKRNPWFNSDPVLTSTAQQLSNQLQAANPDMTIEENLERVTAGIRAMFPNAFPPPQPQHQEGDGEGAVQAADQNTRRRAAAPVAGSAPPPSPRSTGNRQDFASLPPDAKEAFKRYKSMIDAKPGAKPLTEAEWADSYYNS